MPEQDYSNREIQAMFDGVMSKLEEHGEKHDQILGVAYEVRAEARATNGKVAEINKWREQVNGGAKVAAFFMTVIVVPILAWAIFVLSTIESKIHQSIDEALQAYNINNEDNEKENPNN
jgi:hypothetical protein